MKTTSILSLLCLSLVCVYFYIDVSQKNLIKADVMKVRYDEIMATATRDATRLLAIPASDQAAGILSDGYSEPTKHIRPNLDKALQQFYSTLYINMGIDNDKIAQDAIKVHIPVKMVIAYDGYFVHTWTDTFNIDTGKNEQAEIWTPKKPYSYYTEPDQLVIAFTLDDYAYVFDTLTGLRYEGRRDYLHTLYPSSNVFMEVNFDNVRRQTIIRQIQDDLERYTAEINHISKAYGFSYKFNVPYIPEDTWLSTIDDVSFIAFLQGLPVGPKFYNTYGFGGAKIAKARKYYGNILNGTRYYHREGCPLLSGGGDIIFSSLKDAASKGYYPCEECKP